MSDSQGGLAIAWHMDYVLCASSPCRCPEHAALMSLFQSCLLSSTINTDVLKRLS